jgi:hypothetical protein
MQVGTHTGAPIARGSQHWLQHSYYWLLVFW